MPLLEGAARPFGRTARSADRYVPELQVHSGRDRKGTWRNQGRAGDVSRPVAAPRPGTAQRNALAEPSAGQAVDRHREDARGHDPRRPVEFFADRLCDQRHTDFSRGQSVAQKRRPRCRGFYPAISRRQTTGVRSRRQPADQTAPSSLHQRDEANPARARHPRLFAPRRTPLRSAPAQHDPRREHEFPALSGRARGPRPGLQHLQLAQLLRRHRGPGDFRRA